ncbi:MAG: hypothetical protein PWP23_1269 [Candidatus Sumerlaeota bacterium]|nr:hypothetical protein [Candidatus Sumerlaeota bacterium]
MSPRKPIIAALAACLLFALFLYDRGRQIAERSRVVETARIIPFDSVEATFLRIVNDDGEFVLERRPNGEWWMTQPRELRASDTQVKTIVDNLHASKKSAPFTPESLAEYGLDAPLPRLTVRGTDGEYTLLLGTDANRIGRVYATMSGEKQVFTVGDWIRNQGLVTIDHLRDKSLLAIEPERVSRIALRFPQESLTLNRAEGQWWIKEWEQPANESLVDTALRTLATANAVHIADDPTTPAAQLGLETPRLAIELSQEGAEPRTLAIGRKIPGADQFYVQSPLHDGVAIVRAGYIEPLVRSRSDWGTKRFFWMPTDRYTRIETMSGSMRMTLLRDESGTWTFEDTPDVPIHPRKLELFLGALDAWRGREMVMDFATAEEARAKFGIRDVSYQVLAMRADGTIDGLQLGITEPAEGSAFMRRVQDGSVWKVDATRVQFVRAFRADLQDKRIDHGWTGEVKRIVYSDPTTGTGFTIEQRNGVWIQRQEGSSANVLADVAVADFLGIVEELEWTSISALVGEPIVKARLDFQNEAGETVYWFEELDVKTGTEASESFTLRTPKGVFEIRPEGYKRLFEQWVLLLRTASAGNPRSQNQ